MHNVYFRQLSEPQSLVQVEFFCFAAGKSFVFSKYSLLNFKSRSCDPQIIKLACA